jgi:hypothetical protein
LSFRFRAHVLHRSTIRSTSVFLTAPF